MQTMGFEPMIFFSTKRRITTLLYLRVWSSHTRRYVGFEPTFLRDMQYYVYVHKEHKNKDLVSEITTNNMACSIYQ